MNGRDIYLFKGQRERTQKINKFPATQQIFAVSQIKLVVAIIPVVKQTKLEAMNKKTL